MMRLLFFSFFVCCAFLGRAQVSPITITYQHEANRQITFYAENTDFVPYTVTMTFTRLSNTLTHTEGSSFDVLVKRGRTPLTTLRPINADDGIAFAYRSKYTKGDLTQRPDTNFVYLFPLAEGKRVRMNPLKSLETFLGKTTKREVIGVVFRTTEGDTIVTARRGLVTQVVDQSASTGDHKGFDAQENYVEVYHADGSFAIYKLFKNGGIFVQPGDEVMPGQPLGIIGGSNYNGGSHLRFTVSSPVEGYHSFLPSFYLSSGQVGKPDFQELYVSEHPVEWVVKEMSKKEKKKYLEKL